MPKLDNRARTIARRQVLACGGAAVAITALARPAVAAGERRELKMVTAWPKNYPGLGVSAERLASRVAAASNGTLTIRVFAAGELVPPFGNFDAVANGTVDMTHSTPMYWKSKSPVFPFFASVPFGMTASEHFAWMSFGGGQELWDELCGQFGLKPFVMGYTGIQMGGWFRREVKEAADLKGLKIRFVGFGADVYQRLGAAVVTVPGAEIYSALQSGAIDAAKWGGPWNDLAMGFYRITKLYYGPGFADPSGAGEVLIGRKSWDSLSAEHKAILQAMIQAEAAAVYADHNYNNTVALNALTGQHGVTVKEFPLEVLRPAAAASTEVVAEAGDSSPIARKIRDSYMTFLKGAAGWASAGDYPYVAIRSKLAAS